MISSTGDTENSYLYCGEQLDSTTGLYYLRARYMNPSTGTFISMDTYQGSIFDPTSLHKYLYVNANPVTYIDPSGYSSIAENETAMAISGILDEAANTSASFALSFYLKFKASIPVIMMATTGIASFIADSSVLTDICTRFAGGELTVSKLQNEILSTFSNINQTVWDFIFESVNRSSGSSSSSSGGSGASGNFDPNKFQQLINKLHNKVNNIIQRKLQHEYKHAHHFGIEGDWCKQNGQRFYNAILEHINNNPNPIQGTYRWKTAVQHYYDSATGIDVIVDMQNNFLCGWRLSETQIEDLLTKGNVWWVIKWNHLN